MLERCTDPACPRCGCNQSRVVSTAPGLFGGKSEQRACGACGKLFNCLAAEPESADESLAGVVFRKLRCPQCHGSNCLVTSSRAPIRYHRCGDCGARFKSVEE